MEKRKVVVNLGYDSDPRGKCCIFGNSEDYAGYIKSDNLELDKVRELCTSLKPSEYSKQVITDYKIYKVVVSIGLITILSWRNK